MRAPETAEAAPDDLGVRRGEGRLRLVETVGDAEAAAGVDMGDRMTVGAERDGDLGQPLVGGIERGKVGDLAADVGGDALDADSRQARRLGVNRPRAVGGYPELVLGLAGGDLGVGARVDVGVHPHRDAGRAAAGGRDLARSAPAPAPIRR